MGSLFADQAGSLGIYSHAQAYAACPDTELVAVCDRDPERAEACRERWGAGGAYSRPEDLLAEARPQIVSICTPDPTHHSLALQVLGSPEVRAVFMEKPLALDLKEAREVVELAQAKGVKLAVNYMRRYAPGFRQAARLLAAGELGELIAVSGFYTKGVMHNGTHWFDLARWLVGEVSEVRAWNPLGDTAADPCLEVALEFAGGLRGRLHPARAEDYTIFELDLVGSQGRLRLVDADMRFERYQVGPSPWYQGYQVLRPAEPIDALLRDVVLRGVEDLVRCLRTGGRPRCSGQDALAALAIARAALDSAEKGGAACRLA